MPTINHYRLWTPTEDAYLTKRYALDGVLACAKHLGRSKHSTWNRTNKLKLRKEREHPTYMHMDRVKTPVFAYVLGYLWADGSLIKNRNGICFGIRQHDGIAIQPQMDWTGDWGHRKTVKNDANKTEMSTYTVWDKPFVNLLRQLGFSDKNERPFNLACEYLGPDLIPHFVHGFFDGDGCIASTTSAKRYTVTFAAPVAYDWSYLVSILKNAGIEKVSLYQSTSKTGRGSCLYFCRQADVLRFYAVFIHGHEFGLNRKTDRFRDLVEKLMCYEDEPVHGKRRKTLTDAMKADLEKVTGERLLGV